VNAALTTVIRMSAALTTVIRMSAALTTSKPAWA